MIVGVFLINYQDWETKDGAIGGRTGEEPGGLSDADTNVKCLNTV